MSSPSDVRPDTPGTSRQPASQDDQDSAAAVDPVRDLVLARSGVCGYS
jgi:hypothetical protein